MSVYFGFLISNEDNNAFHEYVPRLQPLIFHECYGIKAVFKMFQSILASSQAGKIKA